MLIAGCDIGSEMVCRTDPERGMGLVACSSGKHIKDRPKSAKEDARNSGIGCSKRQSQRWRMQMNLSSYMSTIQHDPKDRGNL